MKNLRWMLGSLAGATAICAAGVLTEVSSWTATPVTMIVAPPSRGEVVSPWVQRFTPAEGDVPKQLDLRGNEVARPVARYRLDERGVLYEVHSPATEVPRLKPPKM